MVWREAGEECVKSWSGSRRLFCSSGRLCRHSLYRVCAVCHPPSSPPLPISPTHPYPILYRRESLSTDWRWAAIVPPCRWQMYNKYSDALFLWSGDISTPLCSANIFIIRSRNMSARGRYGPLTPSDRCQPNVMALSQTRPCKSSSLLMLVIGSYLFICLMTNVGGFFLCLIVGEKWGGDE